MKAKYKGTKFDGTPEEVTKAIELMKRNEPTVTITYLPTTDWHKKITTATDALTSSSVTGVVTYYYGGECKPGIGG